MELRHFSGHKERSKGMEGSEIIVKALLHMNESENSLWSLPLPNKTYSSKMKFIPSVPFAPI